MNVNKKYENIELTPFSVIEITERKVSEKIQPNITVGTKYIVMSAERLAGGCPVALVQHPTIKGRTMRINADRFSWRNVQAEEIMKDLCTATQETEACDILSVMKKHYSDDEINRMLFIPYAVEYIAIYYLHKCLDYARNHKMSCFIKVSRLAKDVLEKVGQDHLAEIGEVACRDLKGDAGSFFDQYNLDFARMWFTISNQLKKINAPEKHLDLVTDAICGIVMIDTLDEFHKERKAKTDRIFGREVLCCHDKRKVSLRSILKVYASLIDGKTDVPFNLDDYHLQLSRRIIINHLNEITFVEKIRNKND